MGYIVPVVSLSTVAGDARSGRIPMTKHGLRALEAQQLFKRLRIALLQQNQ